MWPGAISCRMSDVCGGGSQGGRNRKPKTGPFEGGPGWPVVTLIFNGGDIRSRGELEAARRVVLTPLSRTLLSD